MIMEIHTILFMIFVYSIIITLNVQAIYATTMALIMTLQIALLGLKIIVQVPYNREIIISALSIFMVYLWVLLPTILLHLW